MKTNNNEKAKVYVIKFDETHFYPYKALNNLYTQQYKNEYNVVTNIDDAQHFTNRKSAEKKIKSSIKKLEGDIKQNEEYKSRYTDNYSTGKRIYDKRINWSKKYIKYYTNAKVIEYETETPNIYDSNRILFDEYVKDNGAMGSLNYSTRSSKHCKCCGLILKNQWYMQLFFSTRVCLVCLKRLWETAKPTYDKMDKKVVETIEKEIFLNRI